MGQIDNFEEFLQEFFNESFEMISTMENAILELEKNKKNRDKINEIFRGAHTIKGSAATLELNEIASFAHVFEDSLDFIRRNENLEISSEIVDIILEAIDIVKEMIEKKSEGSNEMPDLQEITEKLENIPTMYGIAIKEKTETKKGEVDHQKFDIIITPKMAAEVRENKKDGEKVFKLYAIFSSDDPMASVGPIQVYSSLRDLGTIFETNPEFEILKGNEFHEITCYLFSTKKDEKHIHDFVFIPDTTKKLHIEQINEEELNKLADQYENEGMKGKSGSGKPEKKPVGEPPRKIQPEEAHTESPHEEEVQLEIPMQERLQTGENPEDKKDNIPIKHKTILRVDSERVDDLLNLVSQLVINKASFSDSLVKLSENIGKTSDYEDQTSRIFKDLMVKLEEKPEIQQIVSEYFEKMNTAGNKFSAIFREIRGSMDNLQNEMHIHSNIINQMRDSVMKVRMVPIEQLFSRFPRIIRDLQKKLNKDVELVLEGQDTELDKSIIEELNDPLMHLLRNSVDHGVETPQERKARGKDPKGTVKVGAKNEGNIIYIHISDDGKGIDYNAIRMKAADKGLIRADADMSLQDIYGLLFLPGFSTAKKISDVSGRGVGLDVVKQAIDKLNGDIIVDSKIGEGSTFTIKLPLTLAIIQALMVEVNDEVYAIPIDSIFETKRISLNEIFKIENKNVIKLREELISVIMLKEIFAMEIDENRNNGYIVIVGFENKKVAIVVDSMIGEEDIVIKPLNNKLTKVPGIAGASILGDGSIALILDVNQLVEYKQSESKEEKELV